MAEIELYLGDCLDVMPRLASKSIDLIIADIPYGEVNRPSSGLRNLNKSIADIETFSLDFVFCHAARLAKTVYIWCGTEQVSLLRAGFVSLGMSTRLCIWEKTNPSPMNGEHLWLSSVECCVFARWPNATFNGRCISPVFRGPTERNQIHPTQKPLWLIESLVRTSSNPNDIVLDFCFGSGTTGVACKLLHRRFVGIEKDAHFFDIAAKRIAETQAPAITEEGVFVQHEQMELLTA